MYSKIKKRKAEIDQAYRELSDEIIRDLDEMNAVKADYAGLHGEIMNVAIKNNYDYDIMTLRKLYEVESQLLSSTDLDKLIFKNTEEKVNKRLATELIKRGGVVADIIKEARAIKSRKYITIREA
tara:strand:+ start:658 stop:1032 length:375 start_codon:yes stop_codon:yes gene_type:complete